MQEPESATGAAGVVESIPVTMYHSSRMGEPVAPPDDKPGRADRDWPARVRWFAAEFLVVLSGVLVALALQAWYNARIDAADERAYLSQLDADLAATERALQDALRGDSTLVMANSRLVSALYRPGPLSPDSARGWLHWQLGWYSDPRPLLGTVTTLIETGDIRLIRDAELRSEIVAYASLMVTDMEELSRFVTRNTSASDTERVRHEHHGLRVRTATGGGQFRLQGTYSDEEVSAYLPGYTAVWPALQADSDLRAANQIRLLAFRSRVFYLDRMIASTNQLRARLRHATAR
jgi:hypothetical protein